MGAKDTCGRDQAEPSFLTLHTLQGHYRLFQEARISGGKAAELLGLTREGFVAWLARQGMPYFRLDPQEWEGEVARIRAANTPAA